MKDICRRALAGDVGADWERIGEGFGLASRLWRVPVSGFPSANVVVKVWEARDKGEQRELTFFRELASEIGIPVPACFEGVWDEEAGRAALVLEDLTGARQGDCLAPLRSEDAVRFARALGLMHAKWWNSEELGKYSWLPSPSLMGRGEEWLIPRRDRFIERFGDRLDSFFRALLDSIVEVHRRGVERLSVAPDVVVHGDLHLDNLLLTDSRTYLLDWARICRGPFAIDLGELCFAMILPRDFDAVLKSYLDEVSLSRSEAERWLGGALLLKFVTSTCGVANWVSGSQREERIVAEGIAGMGDWVRRWREVEPGLFPT